jgi:hypothetical protein
MKWIFAILGLYLIIIFFKAVRDIIRNRYEWSVFTRCPNWFQNFLHGIGTLCRVCDGWHIADGFILQAPYIVIMVLLNQFVFQIQWWWVFVEWVPVWYLGLYQLFNRLYHHWLMKPGYKGRRLDRSGGMF